MKLCWRWRAQQILDISRDRRAPSVSGPHLFVASSYERGSSWRKSQQPALHIGSDWEPRGTFDLAGQGCWLPGKSASARRFLQRTRWTVCHERRKQRRERERERESRRNGFATCARGMGFCSNPTPAGEGEGEGEEEEEEEQEEERPHAFRRSCMSWPELLPQPSLRADIKSFMSAFVSNSRTRPASRPQRGLHES